MSIRRNIPNMVTSCNLLSGVVGLFFAFAGRADIALFCMLAAGIFDFLDGFVARALHCSGEIGRELDSLADLVSFGVLPAVLLCATIMRCSGIEAPFIEGLRAVSPLRAILCLSPILIAAFSALRLAKFNVDSRQHTCFLGLPTPAAAIFCASVAALCFYCPSSAFASLCGKGFFIPLLSLLVCALLVSEIPFFAFKTESASKEVKGSGEVRVAFTTSIKRIALLCIGAIAVIIVPIVGWHFTAIPLLIFGSYILENLLFALFKI